MFFSYIYKTITVKIMKKLLLILLISNFATAQQTDVEIRLVNANVGYPNYINTSQATNSNDAGLNAILQAYNVSSYLNKYTHPYEPYAQRMISIAGTYPPQFITDLLAYSSVVESVRISDMNYFGDSAIIKLYDSNAGYPTGIENNIVVTNDVGLNQIFQTFNVFYYALAIPSGGGDWLQYYKMTCNCDAALLRAALNNYNAAIELAEPASAGYLLSNNSFAKSKATISPNPFLNNFDIVTEELITNYSVFDISGKQIISTCNKNDLDNLASKLQAGMYVLNLVFENGLTANSKLVKK